mgnify:CR=1 FL=1
MKENEKFLKESIDLLNREFGQPLPTLKTVMEKHQEQEVNESETILETPAAIAAAAASATLSSGKGKVKVSTALKNKEHPLHKRALNWVKSKMKKKDDKPKKQSKADADFYRKQYEGKLDEAQKYEIQTRFGRFKIVHDENPTGPGYAPQYFLEVNFENQYLGHLIIAGDPRDKGAKGHVSWNFGKKNVKLGHDK